MVRGQDMFDRIVKNVREFPRSAASKTWTTPRVSLWLTGLRETFLDWKASSNGSDLVDVREEVYLQRLVYFPEAQGPRPTGARSSSIWTTVKKEPVIREANEARRGLGVRLQRLRGDRTGQQFKKRPRRFPPGRCAAVLGR